MKWTDTARTPLALLRELRRIDRMRAKDWYSPELRAAQQALAWALGLNAAAPAKCFAPPKRIRKP